MIPDITTVHLTQSSPIPLDVNFSCKNGEIFVIVGPSGSGKTTILRSIAGLYRPSIGKIISQGNVWYDTDSNINIPVQKRAVGFVFQNYALFPHMTVRDNISIAIPQEDKKKQTDHIDKLLEMVHLSDLDLRFPHQLSGGQQQRVAVARGLARKPKILLLDEPFSSVDQQTRRHLVQELVQLRNQLNIPILHVTHDLNEARRIADKLCIINEGVSLQVNSPENIMNEPINTEVASLTGHDNLFKGALHKHERENNKSFITWQNKILETTYSPKFEETEKLDWFIPSSLVMPISSSASNNNHSNVMKGVILDIIQLGETSVFTIQLSEISNIIHMNYSTHQGKKRKFLPGLEILISISIDGIHLMKK